MKIEITEVERDQIRYALSELANRRAEQSIERNSVADGNESKVLRALAERVGACQEYDPPFGSLHGEN